MKFMKLDWTNNFPSAIIVCDTKGIILEMNEKAAENYASDGGMELIGKNLLDCHPQKARDVVEQMLREKNPIHIQ